MEFRLAFDPPAFEKKINIHDKIIMVGSCFTEHIHNYFSEYKFSCIENPHGTLFNPISIFKSIQHYIDKTIIDEQSLFHHNGLWSHWDFHSRLSDSKPDLAVAKMNSAIENAHFFLKDANWLIITLGTGFVYEYQAQTIVANCHKVPASSFKKRLLSLQEIEHAFQQLYDQLKSFNPLLNLVFTISPVRHLRDGFVENNRSKAILHHVVGNFINTPDVFYFPSFELIIDDLRDYRFYAEDMVHPNYQATHYIWEKFSVACIDGKTRAFMKDMDQLNNAIKHKPIHPNSQEHIKFRDKFRSITEGLRQRFPTLNWEKEIAYFTEN
ncbi:MAG: hypothetical protein RLZ10_3062 [Bacteroidota bacterium]|jgi:hypothetical protein